MSDNENPLDLELKKELDKINWSKYIDYGNVRVQVRHGEKTLTAIERTYPDLKELSLLR